MEVMEYYHQGVDLMKQGDMDGAIELFNRALEEHPDSYSILDRRASAYEKKGEIEKALADYTRMIDLNPQCPDGWNCRGNMYLDNSEYDKAIADFTACIPLAPKGYGAYWSNRGIAYYEKGDLDAALADFDKSIECWTELPNADPSSTSWALTYRGLLWRKKGDLDKALVDLALATTYDPDDDFALYHLGYVWFMLQNYEEAINCFSKAIAARGDNEDAWLARGVCYWNKCLRDKIGFWDEGGDMINLALDDFTKVIELSPENAEAYFNRGLVSCSVARESNNLIKTILMQKTTSDAERLLLLAQLEQIGGKELIPQTDALLRGLRSNRDKLDVLMGESFGLMAKDYAGEAIADLSRAITLDPENAESFYQRGLAHALLGDKEKALADYEQACDLDPYHEKAFEKRDKLRKSMTEG